MSFYEIDKLRAQLEASKRPRRSPQIHIAANALVVQDGQALLVAFDDAIRPHYNFPGGRVEVRETLDEAVRREVQEDLSERRS